jgi:hypothetical protein
MHLRCQSLMVEDGGDDGAGFADTIEGPTCQQTVSSDSTRGLASHHGRSSRKLHHQG